MQRLGFWGGLVLRLLNVFDVNSLLHFPGAVQRSLGPFESSLHTRYMLLSIRSAQGQTV
jgi:hypothetical protein